MLMILVDVLLSIACCTISKIVAMMDRIRMAGIRMADAWMSKETYIVCDASPRIQRS